MLLRGQPICVLALFHGVLLFRVYSVDECCEFKGFDVLLSPIFFRFWKERRERKWAQDHFSSLSRRLKKMRAEYGFVYCDLDLIEIIFNTD